MSDKEIGLRALTTLITSVKRSHKSHRSSILWRSEMPVIVYYENGEKSEDNLVGFGITKIESIMSLMEDFAFNQTLIIERLQKELKLENDLKALYNKKGA